MKNIHLLPTDKPSRLRIGDNGNFVFGMMQTSIQSKNDDFTNQNIYITSDEEIKANVYALINGVLCKTEIKEGKIVSRQLSGGATMDICKTEYLEIILTTDLKLIKDGVQAIDDEFLEWFVKNPSCESVEIKMENYYASGALQPNLWQYKIIIPQEEPETSYVKSETKFLGIEFTLKDGFKQFIPKQETLEEIKLEPLYGSSYCEFSVIENQLATLYRNQEKILTAIKLLNNGKQRNT